MNRSLGLKLAVIAVLALLLMIPLVLIRGAVLERQSLRDHVLEEIARSSSESQHLVGPLLVVPYRKTVREWKVHPTTAERYEEQHERSGRLYFLPERFVLEGSIVTEERRRGIYSARLFHSDNAINGHFQLPVQLGIREDFADYRFDPAFLTVGISDIRGIENVPQLSLNGQPVAFDAGSGDGLLADGVHAPLPVLDGATAQRLDYAFTIELAGTSRLSLTPVGRDTRVQLSADWPHPSFVGDFLPAEREITDRGFTARWQTTFYATNLEEALANCAGTSDCPALKNRAFGVGFVDPVDQYVKSERAIKYALLFIALTFAGFFLYEILERLAVHPIQYGLVGLALALFFLLLFSLGEHIGFAYAYALSASACVLLVGFYVSHVLRSWQRGAGFTAGVAALYGLLFGLLSAEDYALLMGSLLVFGLLACVMILTRKLDWYSLGSSAHVEK